MWYVKLNYLFEFTLLNGESENTLKKEGKMFQIFTSQKTLIFYDDRNIFLIFN